MLYYGKIINIKNFLHAIFFFFLLNLVRNLLEYKKLKLFKFIFLENELRACVCYDDIKNRFLVIA